MTRLPSAGRGTARTRARITEGLACRIDDGRWSFAADMSDKGGGGGTAPDPGVLGRSALASCLAVGYAMWAAHAGVPFTALEVEVEADYDARAEYGVGEGPPGYEALRWIVRVESPAPESEVRRVLATAEERSPWLALIRDPQRLESEVVIRSPQAVTGEA
jgi:putative redox protein